MYKINMKELSYSLKLNIAKKNINNTSFFILILHQTSEAFFLSKKILKKTNIINPNLFIHYPIFLKPFTNYKTLISYFFELTINSKNIIEYINCNNFKFYNNINMLYLFTEIEILKEIEFLFQNSIFLCQTRLAANTTTIIN